MTAGILAVVSALANPPFPDFMLLCIDFQPAYAEAFAHLMTPLRCRLRKAARHREEVHFIYNEVFSLEGEELGDPLDRLIAWGRQERLMLKNARMLRKNFGWVSHAFRESRERKLGVSILRCLMDQGLSSSAELADGDLKRLVNSAHGDYAEFRESSPEAWEEIVSGAIAMPFVFEGGVLPWLKSIRREEVEMVGGFRHRCFDEMCMLLEAGGISYSLNEAMIYSVAEELNESACSQAIVSDFTEELRDDSLPIHFPALELAVA